MSNKIKDLKELKQKAYREVLMIRRLDQIIKQGYSEIPVIIHNVEELVTVRLYLEDLEKQLNESGSGIPGPEISGNS